MIDKRYLIVHLFWHLITFNKGACKYYISTLGVGGGSEGNAYTAYVRDQNSHSPENGFQICELPLNSVVKGHIG